MSHESQNARPVRQPEKKIGPFAGGIGVAIWINTAETADGPRPFRSVTVAPRRYYDREAKEWKDAGSYNPGDLPALICRQRAGAHAAVESHRAYHDQFAILHRHPC